MLRMHYFHNFFTSNFIIVCISEKMMAKMELEKLRNVKLTEEHHDNESHHIMPYEFEHVGRLAQMVTGSEREL